MTNDDKRQLARLLVDATRRADNLMLNPDQAADAIIAAGVLDRVRADAWEEGAAAADRYAEDADAHYHGVATNLPDREPNPYR